MSNNDEKISYIEDDLKKVQVKTNLYIQKYGYMGVFHLAKEIIQNSIDELENPKTNGNKIQISYDKLEDKLIVIDNGRGIPEEDYSIEITCTKLQSGAKFFRTTGGKSSGEFGVGLTVVNALSSYFSLSTYRNTYVHEIVFKDGDKISDTKRPIKSNEQKHGTKTVFVANPKFLGKDTYLPFDIMNEWIDLMSYQISSGIKINVEHFDGTKLLKEYKYKSRKFSDLITKILKARPIFEPVSISGDKTIVEEIVENNIVNDKVKTTKRKLKKDVHLDVCFAYEDDENTIYDSYCNFTRTTEGGIHIDAVEEVVCRYLQNKTKGSMSDKEKEKWDITWNDVKQGLKLIVNLGTDAQVQFMGNAKNKINNDALKPLIKEIMTEELKKQLDDTQKLTNMCKYIKLNARSRVEASKIRKATHNKRGSRLDEFESSKYVACNNTKKGSFKEIFFVEGERSARGTMVNARFADSQAVFGFRGNTKNPYTCSYTELMENAEWKEVVQRLGCGIGKEFNLYDLIFDRINIMTDADIDGYYISLGICSFFVKYLPEVVRAGKLYKVFSPLYRIDSKDHPFVGNKAEMTEIFLKKIIRKYNISIDGTTVLNNNQLYDFLYDINNYRDDLINLQKYFKVSKKFIEIIGSFLVCSGAIDPDDPSNNTDALKDQKVITQLMSRVQSVYPETAMKGCAISGVVDGHFVSIEVNERFIKKIKNVATVWAMYGNVLSVSTKKTPVREMTVGEFTDETFKLMPVIVSRYKGLGEVDAKDLRETTLDINNRITVQLTMEDCEKADKIFRKLQGSRIVDKKLRKQMMLDYNIDPEDLDS